MSIDCHACIGGTSVREDMTAIQAGPQVIVGTPGRVHDMIQRRVLKTDAMKMFVLDEADEMLSVCTFPECCVLPLKLLKAWIYRTNLRHFPTITAIDSSRTPLCDNAARRARGYYKIHARPCPHPRQEG